MLRSYHAVAFSRVVDVFLRKHIGFAILCLCQSDACSISMVMRAFGLSMCDAVAQ
jgi:hypothetical protein